MSCDKSKLIGISFSSLNIEQIQYIKQDGYLFELLYLPSDKGYLKNSFRIHQRFVNVG